MCLSKLLLNAAVTVYSVANSQKLSIQNPFHILKVGITCLCRLLQIFAALLNGDLIPYPTYLYNITGSTNYYNILRTSLGTHNYVDRVCQKVLDRSIQSCLEWYILFLPIRSVLNILLYYLSYVGTYLTSVWLKGSCLSS